MKNYEENIENFSIDGGLEEEIEEEDVNTDAPLLATVENPIVVEESKKGRFKRYSQTLGMGAYKTVYKALDGDTGNEVAWNVINVDRWPKEKKKRIYEEVTLLKKLAHPNIIQGIATWFDPSKQEVVLITELMITSLKRHILKIKNSQPKLKVIKGWCRKILCGIKYLHEQNPPIIHRDIKCDNIFINSNNGVIKIGDLGLATPLQNGYAKSLVGTPEYMAPELYNEKYDTKVDIYAFGMCLLEMITQESPYQECANVGIIYNHVSKGILPESLKKIENEKVKNTLYQLSQ